MLSQPMAPGRGRGVSLTNSPVSPARHMASAARIARIARAFRATAAHTAVLRSFGWWIAKRPVKDVVMTDQPLTDQVPDEPLEQIAWRLDSLVQTFEQHPLIQVRDQANEML